MMARRKNPSGNPNVEDLLNRFAAEEENFLRREFLAPAMRGGSVRVRIGRVACKIQIEPDNFAGWGIFQPTSHTHARLVRRASLSERRTYLDLFPAVRLIVCRRQGNTWLAAAASGGDSRIRIEGMAPLRLAEEIQVFDCVRARYDGSHFWFDELEMRHDPAAAAYLRTALNHDIAPDELERPGLTGEERAVYELNYWESVGEEEAADESGRSPRSPPHRRRSRRLRPGEEPVEADPVRRRLRASLSHAGAQLVDYLERSDSFRVSFRVGERSFTSTVAKEDLTVQVAGICLNGEDAKFDLASLIGVLREGEQNDELYAVGDDGMDEEE
ncbi:MAG: hypothetical protein DWQ31_08790 [Planctomycetota bacterium]|nr:MAG: hypothetical protein DWQ31_08790 [Planctomycetota bacterium]REJ86914.1 MAG: hypothetical protein DWQ35_22380 [Planctomycetota bacterium]REK26603.1 MAG: hypothetical protein DWQ42_08450 [Planctomycetota bacterium]